MAVWGGLTNSCEKKRSEKQGEKERYKHVNAEFRRIARRDKKAFLSNQCKAREFQKNIYFCFIDDAKTFDSVDHHKLWHILKEMGIPDHLRNLYAS